MKSLSAPRLPRTLTFLLSFCGGLALLWGGLTLQRIFLEERDTAKAAIMLRSRAIEQYALVSLEKKLRTRLADARPRIDAALADAMLEESGLLMMENGNQLLPRVARYLDGSDAPASRLYRQMAEGIAGEEGPWGERLALLQGLEIALSRSDAQSITTVVRAFLNHQSRYVLPVTKDLPYRLYFLEAFMERSTPDRSLLQALLRDGLRGTQGHRIVGLQTLLLASRERFTRVDFEFLAEKLAVLCRKARVVHDDFEARVAGGSEQSVSAPKDLKGPALIEAGSWYVTPVEASALYGVAVDLPAMLREIGIEMLQGGLLDPQAALSLDGRLPTVTAVSDVPVNVKSPEFAAEAAEIDRRYAVKTATAITLVALIVGISALIALLYRRERKFIEARASFVATVSHELRTPIASLRLMGETLERRLEGLETARDFPSRIVGEAERLNFLVENILSFNRLEKANVSTNVQSVIVAELVENVRGDAEAFTKKPVNLRITEGSDLAFPADPDLAKLLMSNLINNACKYNARDSVEIELSAVTDGHWLLLSVTDNGTGIPKDEWDAVFTEFVRSRGSGATSGFGLGLALCRRIMELHDGRIRVKDSSDSGTTFELAFPMEWGRRGEARRG